MKYIWVLLLSSCLPFCKQSLLRDGKRNRKNNWRWQERNSFNRYFCACSCAAQRCWAVVGSNSPTASYPNTSTSFSGLHQAFPCSFFHRWPHPFLRNNTAGCILIRSQCFQVLSTWRLQVFSEIWSKDSVGHVYPLICFSWSIKSSCL